MNGPISHASTCLMNQSAHRLGPQPAMHEPFLIPDRFEGARGHLGDQAQNVRSAKGPKTTLILRTRIWIPGVEGRAAPVIPVALAWRGEHSEQDETGLVVGLIKRIEVRPLSQIAQVADEPRGGIDLVGR